MSESKHTYITVGWNEEVSPERGPIIEMGKQNATFEVGGIEFERTGILRLPERMTESEFNQWRSRENVDLIDIYFHTLKQKPIPPITQSGNDAEPESGGEQSELVTDGGEDIPDLTEYETGNELRVYYKSQRSGNEIKREGEISEIVEGDDGPIVRILAEKPEPMKYVYVAMLKAPSKDGEERVHAFSQTAEPDGMEWDDSPKTGRTYTITYTISRSSYLGPVQNIERTDTAPMLMTDGGTDSEEPSGGMTTTGDYECTTCGDSLNIIGILSHDCERILSADTLSRKERNTLMYIESRVVDHGGELDLAQMNHVDHQNIKIFRAAGILDVSENLNPHLQKEEMTVEMFSNAAWDIVRDSRQLRAAQRMEPETVGLEEADSE